MTKLNINFEVGTIAEPAKRLIVLEQQQAQAREQFRNALTIGIPQVEPARKTLMQITRRIQDTKAAIYFTTEGGYHV